MFWVAFRGAAPSCSGTIFVSHLCTYESGNSCTGLSICPTLVLCWLLRLCNESWCWQLYSSSGWFYLLLVLCISNSVFFFLIKKKKNLAAPWSMWDLSSPTKGWTHAACSGSQESLTTGLPGKSPNCFRSGFSAIGFWLGFHQTVDWRLDIIIHFVNFPNFHPYFSFHQWLYFNTKMLIFPRTALSNKKRCNKLGEKPQKKGKTF